MRIRGQIIHFEVNLIQAMIIYAGYGKKQPVISSCHLQLVILENI